MQFSPKACTESPAPNLLTATQQPGFGQTCTPPTPRMILPPKSSPKLRCLKRQMCREAPRALTLGSPLKHQRKSSLGTSVLVITVMRRLTSCRIQSEAARGAEAGEDGIHNCFLPLLPPLHPRRQGEGTADCQHAERMGFAQEFQFRPFDLKSGVAVLWARIPECLVSGLSACLVQVWQGRQAYGETLLWERAKSKEIPQLCRCGGQSTAA